MHISIITILCLSLAFPAALAKWDYQDGHSEQRILAREQQGAAPGPVQNYTKYVVLSIQRSGSGWLRSMLGSHPKLTDYAEIFLKDLHHLRKLATECNAYLTKEGSAHASSFLRKTKDVVPDGDFRYEEYWEPTLDLMSHFTDGNQKAVGFKWMMNQGLDSISTAAVARARAAIAAPAAPAAASSASSVAGTAGSAHYAARDGFEWIEIKNQDIIHEAIEYFNKNNYKVVILDRQNLLRQCISLVQLNTGGIAHIIAGHEKDGSAKEAREKLNITANDFSMCFEEHVRCRNWYDEIEANIQPGFVTRVTYSELSNDPVSVVKRLHSFFGLDSVEIEIGDMVKTHVGPVSDFVEDWENVRAELLKTKYADAVKHWEEDSYLDDMLFIPEYHNSIQMADDGKAVVDLGTCYKHWKNLEP